MNIIFLSFEDLKSKMSENAYMMHSAVSMCCSENIAILDLMLFLLLLLNHANKVMLVMGLSIMQTAPAIWST